MAVANGDKVMSVRITTHNVNDDTIIVEISPVTHYFTREEVIIIATALKRHAEMSTHARKTCPWRGSGNIEVSQCLDYGTSHLLQTM